MFGSVVALASFPIYLITRGIPSAIELSVFGWLLAPILIARFLSHTGRYEMAHVLSSLALTGLVTMLAIVTSGMDSLATVWLVIVPLEAALSGSRRVTAIAATAALIAAGLLVLLTAENFLPSPGGDGAAALAALAIVSASLYATGLALGVEAMTRSNSRFPVSGEDGYTPLAGSMSDVIIRHAADGAVSFVSPAAEALFGTSTAALMGHGLFERVQVADRPAYLAALGNAAAVGESHTVDIRVRRDCGDRGDNAASEFVWIEMRCRPLDPAGRSSGPREVLAVLRDVTERKEQERAVQDARTEAERASAAKGRFLATMSHELRTPLNAIIGFAEMLTQETALMLDLDRRNEYANLIKNSGHHLLSIVDDIVDMSKIETGNLEITAVAFDPVPIIESCCDLMAFRSGEAGVHLDRAMGRNLPEMIADKRAFRQILLNLLSNAIRFSDRGGDIAISARADASTLVLVVEDRGVGISEDDLARIGEPYFQARTSDERRHGGTGLGLSIVKGLVRLHGGELSILSRAGEGTRVTVRLPLDCRPGRSSPPAAPFRMTDGNQIAALKPQPRSSIAVRAGAINQRERSSVHHRTLVKKRA